MASQQYNKDQIKEKLTTEMVFDIVYDLGGDPKMTNGGFISKTICHNHPHEGSNKLYYFSNTKLFKCFTGCDAYFDIFDLIKKVKEIENTKIEWTLYDSLAWVSSRYNWSPDKIEVKENKLADWTELDRYDRTAKSKSDLKNFELKIFDDTILKNLNHPHILHWEKEGITYQTILRNQIGYFAGGEQISIPHFDINGNFIGLRGRYLGQEEAERYGKYRPIIANGIQYNHPLGLNLYNLNNSKEQISKVKKAIVYESEKSTLLYQSYFGYENDISVACCGSSISAFQVSLLLQCGANEIIIAFDRQFQKIGDDEWRHLTRNFKNIHQRYGSYATISFIFDKNMITSYKASPIDEGKEKFLQLYKERVFL